LALSYVCAFLYLLKLRGLRALIPGLGLLPFALLFALWYGSYHHFGIKVLGINFIGNQVTLESFLCGGTWSMVCVAAVLWLGCIHTVFTTDKIVYLLGRVSPHLSLYLSILLRMVPRLNTQRKRIELAQRGIGRGKGQGNIFQRMHNTLRRGSILLTWLTEGIVTTSDSMRCRGCSLRGRTAYSLYRFDGRDRAFVIGLCALISVLLMAVLLDQTMIRFKPQVVMMPITPMSFLFYTAWAALCLLPPALELMETYRFQHLRQTTG
jgi:energy-coupling factor transport system permease protein